MKFDQVYPHQPYFAYGTYRSSFKIRFSLLSSATIYTSASFPTPIRVPTAETVDGFRFVNARRASQSRPPYVNRYPSSTCQSHLGVDVHLAFWTLATKFRFASSPRALLTFPPRSPEI
jgi:hypothetical protein